MTLKLIGNCVFWHENAMILPYKCDTIIAVIAKSLRNTIRMSNSLDPDQDRHSVGTDLGPNCLHVISRRQKSLARKELKVMLNTKLNRHGKFLKFLLVLHAHIWKQLKFLLVLQHEAGFPQALEIMENLENH